MEYLIFLVIQLSLIVKYATIIKINVLNVKIIIISYMIIELFVLEIKIYPNIIVKMKVFLINYVMILFHFVIHVIKKQYVKHVGKIIIL